MSTLAAPAVAERRGRLSALLRNPFLAVFAAAALGAGLGRAVITSYLPYLLDRIDDAPGLIGMVMLVNAAAGFFVPLAVGLWSDRVRSRPGGRRAPFILGGALVAGGGLAAIALGSSTSYLVLAVFGAVTYIGLNAVTTAHRALVPEAFTDAGGRARATSAQELALLVGTLAGVAAGGALTMLSPWAPFVLAAAAVPLLALPTVLRAREPASAAPKPTERRAVGYYVQAATRPGVRAFLGAQLLWVLSYAALPSFFVLYAEDVLRLTAAEASLILSGFGVATAAAVVAAARAREPEHQRTLLGMGVSLMAIGFLGVAAAGDIFAALGALLAAGIGFGLVTTLGFSLFSSLIPSGQEGGYTAMFFSVRAIASAIALPAAGFAIAATGSYRALFLFAGWAAAAALVPLVRVGLAGRERRRLHAPEAHWLVRWGVELVALAAVLLAAGHLLGRTALQRLDEAVFELVNSLGPGPELLWDALNPHTRNYVLLGVLAAVTAAVTSIRLVYPVVALVVASAVVSWGVLELVYAGFDRPRPEEVLGPGQIVLEGNSWGHLESFPSGHMAITTALAAAIALAFPRLRAVLWAYVAAVAFTRVLFGAHFPLDTVAGVVLGYVVARVVYALFVEAGVLERRRTEHGALTAPAHGRCA